MAFKYIEGDLFQPVKADKELDVTVIAHICNDIGVFGAGFVVPLAKHFPKAKEQYLKWHREGTTSVYHCDYKIKNEAGQFEIGKTQFVEASDKIIVANMVAQRDIGPSFEDGKMVPPIRYDQLKKCMYAVREFVQFSFFEGKKVRIACPMFGAGLAGGDWDTIANMIGLIWSEQDIPVNIYYLPQFLPPGWTPPK